MSILLNVARNSCRGSLLQTLSNKSKVHGSFSNAFLLKTNLKPTVKYGPLFSTSQNDLTATAHSDHSHSRIWTIERFLSAGLTGLIPLALAFPNPVFDYTLAFAVTAHVHWGIEAIVVDYVRPNIVGAALSRASVAAVYGLSVLTLGGLFYFNYTDVGLCQAIRMLWKL